MTKQKSKVVNQNISANKTPSQRKGTIASIGNIKYSKWLLIVIIVVTFLTYVSSLSNNFVLNWDDDRYVKDNPLIKELNVSNIKKMFSGYYISNYHPLTLLSLATDYKFFGEKASGFHFVNLLFHILNIILVFLLINKLSGDWRIGIFVSAFFAIHPMHVESVAWVSERKDVLYSFFFLLSMLFYLKYLKSNYKLKYLIVGFVLFILSVLSKSAGIVLPVVLILIDYLLSRKISLKLILEKIPFFIISVVLGLIAISSQKQGGAIQDVSSAFGNIDKILLICYNIFYYFGHAFVPVNLSAFHFYPDSIGIEHWLSVLFVIILSVLLILYKPYRKQLLFGVLFFVICLLMVLQIIPVGGALVAERYTYLPFVGLFFSLSMLFVSILDSKNIKLSKLKLPSIILVVVVFFVFAGMSYSRTKVWKNAETLFSDVIDKEPNRDLGYHLRGVAKAVENNFQGALLDFNKSIEINPKYAQAFYSRGIVRAELKDPENAFKDYSKAIELKPDYTDAFNNRGAILLKYKEYDKAIKDFKSAIEINSEFAKAYYNLAACYINMGNKKDGCENLEKAASLGYDQADAMITKFCK